MTAIARRTGFSKEAVASLRDAVRAGGGRMAQFDHPELGGLGQWMRGGMVMTSASDPALEQRIDHLCDALVAPRSATQPAAAHGGAEAAAGGVPRPADQRGAGVLMPGNADPFAALEKLAALHARGIVTTTEYAAKKAELLARI